MEYNNQYDIRNTIPTTAGIGTSGQAAVTFRGNVPPSEPGLRSRLIEMLGYISEAENLQRDLRRQLYGPFPEGAECNSEKRLGEPGIEELLANACQRSAMLVGEFKSLMARL